MTCKDCIHYRVALRGITFDMRDIGKTVFFTREKAEKALAERSKQ